MADRRVVVTGLGLLCPVGNSVAAGWESILAGRSGISAISDFDVSDLSAKIAGQVNDFNPPDEVLSGREQRKYDPFIQYGIVAAHEAIKDAGLELTDEQSERAGVCVGSGIGGLTYIEQNHNILLNKGPKRISPFFIPSAIINMVAGVISMKHGLKGPNLSFATACTTGTHSVGEGLRIIRHGDADVMVCGGAEMAIDRLGLGGFIAARALSSNQRPATEVSRPWDKARDGFVMGAGSGILVLESLEHAQARGAKIYAELAGYGMSADSYHITAPDPSGSGFVRVMRAALNDAAMAPEEVGYINAHGTSTPLLDPLEATTVKDVFADHSSKLAMSSTKSMTGHLLGAAGAIEAVFSCLALRDQVAPATINLDDPDPACEGLNLVPHTAQEREINAVLSNSFGFGGTNGTLVFKRWQE